MEREEGAHVCELWEDEFFKQTFPTTRKCLLRIGFALGPHDGTWI
jgi:NAD dependent epimerase/dehydratase family enzyme